MTTEGNDDNDESWDDDPEDFDDDAYEGEEDFESDEPEGPIERVSFDHANLPVESAKATKEQLKKHNQRKRKQTEQKKKRELLVTRIIPGLIAFVLLALLAGGAWRLYQKERLRALTSSPDDTGVSAVAEGTAESSGAASQPTAPDLFLGREDLAMGTSSEAAAAMPEVDSGDLVNRYLEAARELTNQGKFADARKLLEKAVLLAPETTDLYLLYGTTYVNEDPGRVRSNAVRALKLDPLSAGGLKLLGLAYQAQRNKGVSTGDEKTLLEMEIADYEDVLERSPDWPELLYACASQRLRLYRLVPERQEDLDETIRRLETVLPLWPEETKATEIASTHHQLGRALKYKADTLAKGGDQAGADALYDRSVAEQLRSLELDPDRFDSLGQIVLVHRARQAKTKALAAVQEHLPKVEHPAVRARVYEMLGGLHLEAEAETEAITAFEEALKLSAKLPNSYLALAKLHWENGDATQTEQMLTRGISAIPNFLDAHCKLGLFYVDQGSPQQAIAVLERAIRIQPPQAVLVNVVPSRNAARNRYYYQAASALAGLYLEANENTSEARHAATFAQQFAAADSKLLDTMGWIHFKDGEYEKAAGHLEPLATAPDASPVTLYHLAAVYAKQDRNEDALRVLVTALQGSENFPGREEAESLRAELEKE